MATPEANTDPEALDAEHQLATTVGARWRRCDAPTHVGTLMARCNRTELLAALGR
ncbi:MAG: hypothetical protein NT158_02070 [Cyanobacteria bacterium]|nr:hypothetical protein [Cyanobacteriota bacterium]